MKIAEYNSSASSKHARIRDWTIEYRNTLIKVAYKCQLMKIFIKNWNIKFRKYFKRHDKKMKEYRTILMESKHRYRRI